MEMDIGGWILWSGIVMVGPLAYVGNKGIDLILSLRKGK